MSGQNAATSDISRRSGSVDSGSIFLSLVGCGDLRIESTRNFRPPSVSIELRTTIVGPKRNLLIIFHPLMILLHGSKEVSRQWSRSLCLSGITDTGNSALASLCSLVFYGKPGDFLLADLALCWIHRFSSFQTRRTTASKSIPDSWMYSSAILFNCSRLASFWTPLRGSASDLIVQIAVQRAFSVSWSFCDTDRFFVVIARLPWVQF